MEKASLIFKVLSREASQDERAELEHWIAQSEANKSEYDDLKLLWEHSSTARPVEPDHFYAGLDKIKSKIRLKRSIRRRNSSIKWVSAIVVTVLVTIALFIVTDPASKRLLRFDNATLGEIIPELEKSFHIDIETGSDAILACRFTGTFYKKDDEQAMIQSLSKAMNLNYEVVKSNVYRLTGSGCLPVKQSDYF